jgi:hypothetical protein
VVCEDHYNSMLQREILNTRKSVIQQLEKKKYVILDKERLREEEKAFKVRQAEQKAKETLLKEQAALLLEQAAEKEKNRLVRNQLLKEKRAGQKLPKKTAKPLDQTFSALKALRIKNYAERT